jgi:hypothetical protein
MRIQYPCAIYHVVSRGDRYEDIFPNDGRHDFLETLAEACHKDRLTSACLSAEVSDRSQIANSPANPWAFLNQKSKLKNQKCSFLTPQPVNFTVGFTFQKSQNPMFSMVLTGFTAETPWAPHSTADDH